MTFHNNQKSVFSCSLFYEIHIYNAEYTKVNDNLPCDYIYIDCSNSMSFFNNQYIELLINLIIFPDNLQQQKIKSRNCVARKTW